MGILFFNFAGYRLLSDYLRLQAARQLTARLDSRQFDETDFILFKVPVTHLAYYNNSAVFDREDGQVEIGGIPYHFVESRIYHDSIELLCLIDQAAFRITHSGNDYCKAVRDELRNNLYTLTPNIHMGDLPCRTVAHHSEFPISFQSPAIPTDEQPPNPRS